MKSDIDYLRNVYFSFDKAVPYSLRCGVQIEIKPVLLIDSMIFMSSYGILTIDKNTSDDIGIIQMSYLKYLNEYVLNNQFTQQQMINICRYCLGFTMPIIGYDDNGRAILYNFDVNANEIFRITANEFDDIKRIILYQNLPNYDDDYIDPELKANMEEMKSLKSKGYDFPSIERRIAIISSHSGITKREQLEMTLRSHTLLFEEVYSEVEYIALKSVACFGGKGEDVQWIYRKAKGKYDDYITSVEKYNKSMGGDGYVKSSTNLGENNFSQYDKFIGG